ncbi:MAG TPA: sigma-70 family RNA polymerase sigma factor, partial [Verrucomicrobiae bacterium]|nr:sigma-70 family RNA polymerase sigma factor [Verrucomicrobiae bacterium]
NTLRARRFFSFSFFSRGEQDDLQAALDRLPARDSAPDEDATVSERAALLRRCIATLPEKHQQVIYLRFYVDDSLEGIAAALGCSVGTVKSRLFYALDKLRGMRALQSPDATAPPKISTL